MANEELMLHPSRLKLVGLLVVCALFFAIGVAGLRQSRVIGWACMVFFGLGCAIALVSLLPGASYLRLTDEGFELCAFFRKTAFIPWGEVSEFRVAQFRATRMVVFDWKTRQVGSVRKINRALVGGTDGLGDNYGMKHQALADLLNERRSRALAGR